MAVGAWRRIAISCSGTTGKAYVATPTGTTEAASGTVSTSQPTGITLGGRSPGDSSEYFNGRLRYVRVWSTQLTQAQIEAEWASPTPVVTANLWADWRLADASDLADHSGNGRDLVAGSTAVSTEDDPPFAYPPAATGSGAAYDATVTTSGAGTSAPAGLASGTGAAGVPTAGVGVAAGVASGTGVAAAPAASVAAAAGAATGTGAARTVSPAVSVSAGNASGTGSAAGPAPAVGAGAQVASGTGSALGPSASTGNAAAGVAAGTGAALDATVHTTSAAPTGSWYGLLDIVQEAMDLREAELAQPPPACLDCGEPLRIGPNGEQYCSFDGSVWDAGNRRVGTVSV
jgi:hypothetical protein